LLAVLAFSSLLNLLLTPAFSLLPILVTQHFGGGALELAWINTASGVGFVLGGLLLSVWGGFQRRILTSLVGLVGLGVGVLAIGLIPANGFFVALVCMAIVGVMGPLANGPFFAVIQSVVAPEMQGRVFTVLGSISASMAPIGLAIAGPLADWLGVRVWYGLGGVTCLVLSVIMACIPAIMQLEEGRTRQASGDEPTQQPATPA
jgi:MFS transporter, DHA3 family, macrolide efflux protein